MKEIFYNYDFLTEEEINNIVKRAKMLIVNTNDEILLGKCNNTFQILGGHVEENETYDECVVREIKEETGIDINCEERKPFLIIRYYCKKHPRDGLNTEYIIKYYLIKTDLKPDLKKISLTQSEKEGFFELCYINKKIVLEILADNLKTTNSKNTVLDAIEVIKEYLKQNN